ncbi:hypothetical protein Lser_V15G39128 [Lactuca serriola]
MGRRLSINLMNAANVFVSLNSLFEGPGTCLYYRT